MYKSSCGSLSYIIIKLYLRVIKVVQKIKTWSFQLITRNLEVIDSSAIKFCLQFPFHKNPLQPAEAPL